MTKVGYLGPAGTFSGEALATSPLVAAGVFGEVEEVPLATINDTVVAVGDGRVDRAIVPIENSLEGSVDATLDALALDAPEVEIVAEAILAVRHCLIAAGQMDESEVTRVISHPQVIGQCAEFIRTLGAEVVAAPSTAEAVRMVTEARDPGWVAIGNRLAASLYGAEVLREELEDHPGNETRFVWLAPSGDRVTVDGSGPRKTSLVFWGSGAGHAGWLVECLSEFAKRDVNLTRIESRPRGAVMGRYMFFVDLEGAAGEEPVAGAVAALAAHCDHMRVLGSFPAAPR